MQQAVLDDWFLRQDILDQLMSQEEEFSEAERYADRIMRIAQEDSAGHQVLSDPFDRSVALVLSLVKEEGMDPWNIDLSAFLKLFTQRVRKRSLRLGPASMWASNSYVLGGIESASFNTL